MKLQDLQWIDVEEDGKGDYVCMAEGCSALAQVTISVGRGYCTLVCLCAEHAQVFRAELSAAIAVATSRLDSGGDS